MVGSLRDYFQVLKIGRQHFTPLLWLIPYPLYGSIEKIKVDDKILAFAIYSFGKLHYFAVHKKHYKTGLGKTLINKVKNRFNFLRVEFSNKHAYQFFKNSGFSIVRIKKTFSGKRIIMKMIPKENISSD